MPEATWWALHAAQDGALVAAMGLAAAASRRAGAHTPYGQMLFLLVAGFWLLLLGEAAFLVRNALGLWQGPGGLPDMLSLPGWALLVASVAFFVVQFSPQTDGNRRLVLYCLGVAALFALLFFAWLSPPGADPDAGVRVAYLAADAAALGLLVGGIDRFRRLHRSALGRLYIFLGAAIVLKAAGDLFWAYLAARGASSPVATAFYPVAGALALVGLALHHRDMRHDRLEAPLGMPWMTPPQLVLRDAGQRLQEMAGGYAARTYLQAAASAFEERGVSWRIRDGTVESHAPPEAWEEALERGRSFARHLGAQAERAVAAARGLEGV